MIVFCCAGYDMAMHTSIAAPDSVPITRETLLAHVSGEWPLPGGGQTLERWRLISGLARVDLPLVKLVEPHHDAVAILKELNTDLVEGDQIWAVWAAEPPYAVLRGHQSAGQWTVDGRKAFCSGAGLATHALVTASTDGGPRLFAVDLRQDGISSADSEPPWVGAGMKRAATSTLRFDRVSVRPVGGPDDYTRRAGFWWGAIGIAAAWFGGACGVADRIEKDRGRLDAHGLAHLGAVRAESDVLGLAFEGAARLADEETLTSQQVERLAQSIRAMAASLVSDTVERCGRVLGPGPLAFDSDHSARVADIQVFVRQHHAEKDLERLGSMEATDAR